MHGEDQPVPSWATVVRAPNPGPMTLDGTNTWVLRSAPETPAVIIDPGPADRAHLRAVADHGPIAAILVTHGHPDHTDGLAELLSLTGAPVWRLSDGVPREVAGVRLTAVDAPGHTADSVCFVAEVGGEAVVLTGDTILGRGTTVVAWPDGDLGDYLASLRRLMEFGGHPILPGHGPARPDCAAAARYYLDHRRERLAQVRAAVAAGADTPAAVVQRVYADVDRALWPAAEWSVRAQLAYLDSAGEPGRSRIRAAQEPKPRVGRESSAGSPPLDSL